MTEYHRDPGNQPGLLRLDGEVSSGQAQMVLLKHHLGSAKAKDPSLKYGLWREKHRRAQKYPFPHNLEEKTSYGQKYKTTDKNM